MAKLNDEIAKQRCNETGDEAFIDEATKVSLHFNLYKHLGIRYLDYFQSQLSYEEKCLDVIF